MLEALDSNGGCYRKKTEVVLQYFCRAYLYLEIYFQSYLEVVIIGGGDDGDPIKIVLTMFVQSQYIDTMRVEVLSMDVYVTSR